MNNKDMPAYPLDELPGMLDELDFRGAEAGSAEALKAHKEQFLLKVRLREAALAELERRG